MELDLYNNDDSILFSDGTFLKTVTRDQRTSVVASGFINVTSFKQINVTHIAVADFADECLKMVNRDDNSVIVITGQCDAMRISDGYLGHSFRPQSVELDVRNPGNLLVTDRNALRSVNIDTGTVRTVISFGFSDPRGATWIKNRLMVANDHYISEVVWFYGRPFSNTMIAGSNSSGDTDGSFTLSRFSSARDIHPISDDLYLVADDVNNKLRLLDINTHQVLPVCTDGIISCNKSTTIHNPFSVLKTPDAVYVGQLGKITKLTGGLVVQTIAPMGCREKNITVETRYGEMSAVVDIGDGYMLSLKPGIHQFSKDNCSIRVFVEANPPAAVLSQRIKSFSVGSFAAISGLLLVFVMLTVTFIILFIKIKRRVHKLEDKQYAVIMELPNAVEPRPSAGMGVVDHSYDVPNSPRISRSLNHTRPNFHQSYAGHPYSPGNSVSYECVGPVDLQSAVADHHQSEISEVYYNDGLEIQALNTSEQRESSRNDGIDPPYKVPNSSNVFESPGYNKHNQQQTTPLDLHTSGISEGCDYTGPDVLQRGYCRSSQLRIHFPQS